MLRYSNQALCSRIWTPLHWGVCRKWGGSVVAPSVLVMGKKKKFFQGFVAKELIWVGKISWRRKWQPTPIFLPGKSHRWRSLVGYSPWGHKESDTTERLHFHFQEWKKDVVLVLGWKSSSLIRENGGVLGTRFGGFS